MGATVDHVCVLGSQISLGSTPEVIVPWSLVDALVEPTAPGDPDSPLRWTSRSVRTLAVALEGVSPITDAIASGWYRGEVLPVHLGRLLLA